MTGVQTCALRSEEHTSELQSHDNLVCRLLLEKKKPDDRVASVLPPRAPGPRSGGVRRAPGDGGQALYARNKCEEQGVLDDFRAMFFFNDAATPEARAVSPPDALPI